MWPTEVVVCVMCLLTEEMLAGIFRFLNASLSPWPSKEALFFLGEANHTDLIRAFAHRELCGHGKVEEGKTEREGEKQRERLVMSVKHSCHTHRQ